jgi:RNA-directed DNA polymerase
MIATKEEQKQINQAIKDQFAKLKSTGDLVDLINAVGNLLYPEDDQDKLKAMVKPIKLKTVTFYANSQLSADKCYKEFTIKKKSGGERTIAAPVKPLKLIQSALNAILSAIYEPKSYVTGFVPHKSIVDNAKAHVNKNYVYNIDLVNFFPSIELHRVKAVLKLEPFSLNSIEREKLAFLIARLCCKDGRLPQGSPTSPVLSNIVCQQLDRRLNGLAKSSNCRFTRYADDITFSANKDVFNQKFKTELERIVKEQHFAINQKKTRLQGLGYRQEVTGLIVNEKINVSKRYMGEVRAMLNNWDKKGYEAAEQRFLEVYISAKSHTKEGNKPSFKDVLWGKLQFLSMVRGQDDALVLRYVEQYRKLNPNKKNNEDNTKKSIINLSKHLPVDTTKFLQLFSEEGSNFKFLVHDYLNGPFIINDFINDVKGELNSYENSNVKYSLRKRIESFIDIYKAGKYKQWYFNNIPSKFSFSNTEVLDWCSQNSGRHPIHNFEKEILFFKNSMKIYDGSLKNYINEIAAQQLGDLYTSFEIEYENVEKAEFYTDVDALLSGIRGIFNSIKQRANKSKKIKIEFRARNTLDGRLRILNIIHIDSICEKPLNKSDIFSSDNGGDFKAIEQRFFQVCDWSITANNPDNDFNKLNILYDINKDKQPREKIDSSKIQGFTHTMTFYS